MKRHVWLTWALAAALVLGPGSLALAESPEEGPMAEATAELAEAPVPVYGMQAWIDADTGQLRGPTASEAAQHLSCSRPAGCLPRRVPPQCSTPSGR